MYGAGESNLPRDVPAPYLGAVAKGPAAACPRWWRPGPGV